MLCLRVDDILGSLDIIGSVVEFCDIVPINAITLEEKLVMFSEVVQVGFDLRHEEIIFEFRKKILKISLMNPVNYEGQEYSTFIAGSLELFCKKCDMFSGKFCDAPLV